jgi:hypothetical protein
VNPRTRSRVVTAVLLVIFAVVVIAAIVKK